MITSLSKAITNRLRLDFAEIKSHEEHKLTKNKRSQCHEDWQTHNPAQYNYPVLFL